MKPRVAPVWRGRRVGWRPHSRNATYAGVRYRCLNPLRALRARGLPVELYVPGQRYDLVLVQGLSCLQQAQADAATGAAFMREVEALQAAGCRVVVDDCDNHFYNPQALAPWQEASQHLRTLLAEADAVVASTAALAEVLQAEVPGLAAPTVIGDGVEMRAELDPSPWWKQWLSPARRAAAAVVRRHRAWLATQPAGATALVWFGSHGSAYADGGMRDLLRLRAPLEALHRDRPLSLTVISNHEGKFHDLVAPFALPTAYHAWDRANFPPLLALHDVAVLPITPSPFTVCKTANRMAQALAAGLAVCADAIPSYREFAAVTMQDDWAGGLAAYAAAPALRARHVAQARDLIAARHTTAQVAQQWAALFERVLQQPPRGAGRP